MAKIKHDTRAGQRRKLSSSRCSSISRTTALADLNAMTVSAVPAIDLALPSINDPRQLAKLPEELLLKIFEYYAINAATDSAYKWKWHGFPIDFAEEKERQRLRKFVETVTFDHHVYDIALEAWFKSVTYNAVVSPSYSQTRWGFIRVQGSFLYTDLLSIAAATSISLSR
ncbi:hypothetical protein LTR95_000613 [Oleoguttula sp. CCFEE 5521]